jgi:glycerate kinase
VGGTLRDIARIDTSALKIGVPVTAMVDVDNPLYGQQGAAFVFAPQKGADAETVRLLDDGLRHFARLARDALSMDVAALKGGGAAGGLGAGAVCFLNARLRMGIDVLLDAADFEARLNDADLVLTGEGKLDAQSLRGKTVLGVAKRAKEKNVPVIAVVGDIGDDIEAAYGLGITGIFSINRVAAPIDEAVRRSENDLYLTIENLMRVMKSLTGEGFLGRFNPSE